MTYSVYQNFEGLGDTCERKFSALADAKRYADELRAEISAMVAEMDTADEYCPEAASIAIEIDAWQRAEGIAGVEYDPVTLRRSPNSPRKYGAEAGQYIADMAVVIEEGEE